MVLIEFLGPIAKEAQSLEINSLEELYRYMEQDEVLREWIDSAAVAVNDTIITQSDYKLKSGDRVSILPPVCGG